MAEELAAKRCPLCGGTNLRSLHTRSFQDFTWKLGCCGTCGLNFTDPVPTDAQIRRFYSGEFHSELLTEGGSEKAFGDRFRTYVDWVLRFVPGGRSVDIGCSTGLLPKMFRDKGFEAEGVELNPETAAWGASHYGIPIRNGGVELLEERPGFFDLVTMTEVVEHTVHPVEFLRRVNGILRLGGHALVTFPDIRSPKSLYYRLVAKLTGREWAWVSCRIPFHIWEFTYETARMTFERAGFRIVAFRRVEIEDTLEGKANLLTWPTKPLSFGPLARRFGSQMEFVIRKTE